MTTDKMPLRSVKVPDSIWVPARKKADAEGTTVSDVIRESLRRYGTNEVIAFDHDPPSKQSD